MAQITVFCRDKDDFRIKIENMISDWERMMELDGRRQEYENVIWGAHRILSFLDVEYEEHNDVS
jgi:hypothetical protein